MRQLFLLGSPYWSAYLCDKLQEEGVNATALRHNYPQHLLRVFSDNSASLLAVGYGGRLTAKLTVIWTAIFLWWLMSRRPASVTLYWIGGDVLSVNEKGVSPALMRLWRVMSVRHLCGAPWFVDVLTNKGVHADPVLFPYDAGPAEALKGSAPPVDNKVRVCAYLTPTNWDNMNGGTIMRIARRLDGSHWNIVGMNGEQAPPGVDVPSNVHFLGWVEDPLAALADSHVFVRLADHDAYSGMVRDAQAMGRTVVYTKDVPGVAVVSTQDQDGVLHTLREVASRLASGEPVTQLAPDLPPFQTQVRRLAASLSLD